MSQFVQMYLEPVVRCHTSCDRPIAGYSHCLVSEEFVRGEVKEWVEMAESHMYKQQSDQFHTAQIQHANIYDLTEKEDYMRHFIGGWENKFATARRLKIAHSALNMCSFFFFSTVHCAQTTQ